MPAPPSLTAVAGAIARRTNRSGAEDLAARVHQRPGRPRGPDPAHRAHLMPPPHLVSPRLIPTLRVLQTLPTLRTPFHFYAHTHLRRAQESKSKSKYCYNMQSIYCNYRGEGLRGWTRSCCSTAPRERGRKAAWTVGGAASSPVFALVPARQDAWGQGKESENMGCLPSDVAPRYTHPPDR